MLPYKPNLCPKFNAEQCSLPVLGTTIAGALFCLHTLRYHSPTQTVKHDCLPQNALSNSIWRILVCNAKRYWCRSRNDVTRDEGCVSGENVARNGNFLGQISTRNNANFTLNRLVKCFSFCDSKTQESNTFVSGVAKGVSSEYLRVYALIYLHCSHAVGVCIIAHSYSSFLVCCC